MALRWLRLRPTVDQILDFSGGQNPRAGAAPQGGVKRETQGAASGLRLKGQHGTLGAGLPHKPEG